MSLLRMAPARSTEEQRRVRLGGALRRWALRLAIAVAVIAVVIELGKVAVRISTSYLWFDSVDAGSVYSKEIWSKVLLFSVFGILAAAIGGVAFWTLRRARPRLAIDEEDDVFRAGFRRHEARVRWLLLGLAVVVPGVRIGERAAAQWQTYLLWSHASSWHRTDPLFHKDISFFVEVYPFHVAVVSLLSTAVEYGLIIAVLAGYWYGAWRLRGGHQKVTRPFVVTLSLLAAAYVLLKAVGYWLARYAVTTSGQGPVTGAGYTAVHALLPSKDTMVVIAVLGAAALVVNGLAVGRARMLAGSLAALVVAALVVGIGWPKLVYRLREAPSAAQVDLPEIAQNQRATRTAFGLDGNVKTVAYNPSNTADSNTLTRLANRTAQIPVIDPNKMSPTFTVKQQLQPYYQFKSTLDVGHYDLPGAKGQDVALAARELSLSGIPSSTWVNSHLVYTHGYGVVAAPVSSVNADTESPNFLDGGMPASQEIPINRPQVYFGQGFPANSYSIVGQPAGSHQNLEFDHPAPKGSSDSAHTTYQGDGGIPIGSTLRRMLFAAQLKSPSILFSSELNKASQLLEVRSPRARVAKVAPWLTLDGDVYPAVVDGKIDWVVDGYTTSNRYPDAQRINLHSATNTTLTQNGSSVSQASAGVNYMHNSVKAVVDAYTGKVTLYAWNQKQQPDPLLTAWESVFPGLVKPQSSISSALLPQLRYPTDLFNVQRTLLAKYHVNGAANFYSGNDFWTVPTDPTVAAANTINSSGASTPAATPNQPSQYMSLSADGYGHQRYALSSPMVTYNGRDLAAFVSVDAQPGPDYGKFTVLSFPSEGGGESPSQVQNDIESDTTITEALTLQRGGQSKVVLGSLEAIPVAGRLLYVEPVYTQSTGSQSFPILRHVIALYGNGAPSFDNGLQGAVQAATKSAASRH
ncbi:UPF0182 protein [Flexivirga endophytica]|uniref:UPF0182 protein n=1 Tax=Flexivirga endophytica TaxID=1849103 RepID=A0A916THI2_9MICO|nr:UPF0182 family protein [Flexivirga endophytica]GGB45151.1 UPF0182 protein [Flexivirga endophytica]GHB68993.1 UPF0182 protein [Flexivirga endophytica]